MGTVNGRSHQVTIAYPGSQTMIWRLNGHPMTEWNASGYARVAALQAAMAAEVLGLLEVKPTERVLDLGCGNGKVTAEIAKRVGRGSVVGIDSSAEMIAFAQSHVDPAAHPNLRFETCDVRQLPFRNEFDLVVSFNALHWITDQAVALRSIRSAMKQDARAQLRLVPAGRRKSLENVIEETRLSERWSRYFAGFHDPYLHLTADQYATLAERSGLNVLHVTTSDNTWDFGSRPAFAAFGMVTFVEWTKCLPEAERPAFVSDVLDRYRAIAAEQPGGENVFKFYQMDIALANGPSAI
jgi:trans-aconitate 2-methyltransferase